jgi:hypothetical protein
MTMDDQDRVLKAVKTRGIKVGDIIWVDLGFQECRVVQTEDFLFVEPAWERQIIERPEQIQHRCQGLIDMLTEIDEKIAELKALPAGAVDDAGLTKKHRLAGTRRLRVEIVEDINDLIKE